MYIDEVCKEIINHTFSADENIVCDLYGKTKVTYNEMVKTILKANHKRAFLLHLPIKPIQIISEFCYKFSIPFPIYPEQISHMCEDSCSKTDSEGTSSNEFFITYADIIHKNT